MTKKQKLLKEIWREFSLVDPDHILTKDARGVVYIGGEMADVAMLQNLKQEAEFLLESHLWKLMTEVPKELAHKEMFINGESLDSVRIGRSMLFVLKTQKNIVELLKSYSQTPQKK